VDFTALFDGTNTDVAIIGPYYSPRSSDTRILMELACLAKIMEALKPLLVFEIGTFVGRTTRLFANNAPPNCQIVTLDLEPQHVPHQIGEAFLQTDERRRITQCYGDSRTFDFSPWYGKCDFVWVDACHDYEYVVSDTETAMRLCRPGGWVGWHDYRHTAWWSGVTRCVRELAIEHSGMRHIRGTTIAMLKND
jgi:predicted O-methyltransferase YrrM